MIDMKKNIELDNGHNYPFDSTLSPFSHFEERILPKIVWILFIMTLIVTFGLFIMGINPLVAISPLGLWFIFLVITEVYLMKK